MSQTDFIINNTSRLTHSQRVTLFKYIYNAPNIDYSKIRQKPSGVEIDMRIVPGDLLEILYNYVHEIVEQQDLEIY